MFRRVEDEVEEGRRVELSRAVGVVAAIQGASGGHTQCHRSCDVDPTPPIPYPTLPFPFPPLNVK